MEQQVPHDAASFLFTHFHAWPIEYVLYTFTVVLSLCIWLLLRSFRRTKGYSFAITVAFLLVAASQLYALAPTTLELGRYGKLREAVPIHSKLDALDTRGKHFIEPTTNRTILLRGVNFGGGSKIPSKPFQPTHILHE